MNKVQELNALLAFITTLPIDSYLRPWLEQEAQAIERAMAGDMPLEGYCHGFNELRDISKRLDEREAAIAKKEQDLRTFRNDLLWRMEAHLQIVAEVVKTTSTSCMVLTGAAVSMKKKIEEVPGR